MLCFLLKSGIHAYTVPRGVITKLGSDKGKGAVMYEIHCNKQNDLRYGDLMCTTASMCFGVAFISGNLTMQKHGHSGVVHRMNEIMMVASKAHRKFELRNRGGETRACPQMASVHEILVSAGIDLTKLGMVVEEFMVTNLHFSQETKLLPSGVCKTLAYEPSTCTVPIHMLPEILIPRNRHDPVVATFTNGKHTVCLFNSEEWLYGMFDPGSGTMRHSMTRSELIGFVENISEGCAYCDMTVMARKRVIL